VDVFAVATQAVVIIDRLVPFNSDRWRHSETCVINPVTNSYPKVR
jgi:hypothetical protein